VASAAGLYVLPSRVNSSSEGAQEPAVCDVDPLDIVAAIREGLLDPGLTVDIPRDKEGQQ